MPELPDLEGFRRIVATRLQGELIERADVSDAALVVPAAVTAAALQGRRVVTSWRHGKRLVVETDGPALVLRFGMTGTLRWTEHDVAERFSRIRLRTSTGELHVVDRRRLGAVAILVDGAAARDALSDLGPDAAAIDRDSFIGRIERSRASVKATLMDQHVIAGLGNMLSDEVLWRARIHPARRAFELAGSDLGRLHTRMGAALRSSSRAGRIPRSAAWLSGQRDVSTPVCPRCATELIWSTISGRSSLWCPRCQPAG